MLGQGCLEAPVLCGHKLFVLSDEQGCEGVVPWKVAPPHEEDLTHDIDPAHALKHLFMQTQNLLNTRTRSQSFYKEFGSSSLKDLRPATVVQRHSKDCDSRIKLTSPFIAYLRQQAWLGEAGTLRYF
ncbi:hypothetical protein CDAR_497431 [Caerostris darwini]|uniref:Uncharacterized protein n=1 Tax=Caerostris darwini TaxID=1538125 RepID=A0AAV4S0U2_9ARAC|nr:hypothetical protein CDAR_497431 [Caerostris darwini]